MLKPSSLFDDDTRADQIHALNYGKCSKCDRGLSQGEEIYVGTLVDGSMAAVCEKCKSDLSRIQKTYVYHPKDFLVPEKDTQLWRYQDFPKFVSLLDSGELFFTRADNFEDVFEGARGFNFQKSAICDKMRPALTLKVKSQLQAVGKDYPTDDEVEDGLKEEINKMFEEQEQKRKDYFVSCWHANERESEAMWKLYSSAKNQGVAIQTTMKRLCYSIGKKGFEVGAVRYISFEEPLEANAVPIWYKRTAFEHEKEVRVIFHELGVAENGMSVKMDLDMLIEQVYVSPSAKPWFASLVKNVLSKYGVNKPVEYSRLDEKPFY